MMEFLLKLLPSGWVNRHESCVGIRLYKVGQRTAEIWFCPAGYTIEKHSHNFQDIELLFIYGTATCYRTNPDASVKLEGWCKFKSFTIAAGVVHWFSVSDKPLVFINFAKWKKDFIPTSAAIDFSPVTPHNHFNPLEHEQSK